MRSASALVFACVLLAGCGGGGGGTSSALSNNNTMAGNLPTSTTTYTGTLYDAKGNTLGPISLTIQPNGIYTGTTSYGPGFVISGNLSNLAQATAWTETFTVVPNANGFWVGQAVTGGTTYTGSGNLTFGEANISGTLQFGGGGFAYGSSHFTATP